jgi:hypothetical protein
MANKAVAVERGCGRRTAGGVYLEVGLSAVGLPLEAFLVDPPIPLRDDVRDALGITPVGVKLQTDRRGVTHVWDWVGSQHYQNVCDFLEEVRRFGLSRRLPKTLDFSVLSDQSQIKLVHARAHIENHDAFYEASGWQRVAGEFPCPCKGKGPIGWGEKKRHPDPAGLCCAGLWWHDVEGGEPSTQGGVNRVMPSFAYLAHERPAGLEPQYVPALFAAFPISRLVVVRDEAGGTHDATMERVRQAQLPADLEDA